MDGFRQLCVLPGVSLGDKKAENFEEFIANEFQLRIRFAEEVLVMDAEEESGCRHDLLFYIHEEDLASFTVWQFKYGVLRWEEILYDEEAAAGYPRDVLDKYRIAF